MDLKIILLERVQIHKNVEKAQNLCDLKDFSEEQQAVKTTFILKQLNYYTKQCKSCATVHLFSPFDNFCIKIKIKVYLKHYPK